MIIIGAKGFAKEVLEVFHQRKEIDHLTFYDDVSPDIPEKLFDLFPVYNSLDQVKTHFATIDNRFTIGIGNPLLRKKMADRFSALGGVLTSVVSDKASIGSYGVTIGEGCNFLEGVIISNDVTTGNGCLLYYNVAVTHDCVVGDFVELSPSVALLGRSTVDSYTHIGAGSIVLPDVKVGRNVIVGAGSLVTKDIPDNAVAYGHPAKVIRMVEAKNDIKP